MRKIKSCLAFIFTLCLIVPALLMFTACSNGNINKLTGTNIIAEGEFEKGTVLSSNEIEEDNELYQSSIEKISEKDYNAEKVAVYNISLNNNGKKVQPNKKVKITMAKPFESSSGYITFHIKEDNVIEELITTENATNIIFETTSFSPFIVASKKNTPITPAVTITHSLENSAPDSLEHKYNGTAVFVSKKDIIIDGTKLSDITDEEILNKITYVWRDKNTKVIVTPDVDITINGKSYIYGKDNDKVVGDEFAGPCTVGEYEFVLSYNGVEALTVEAKITENSFSKISSYSEFKTTDKVTFGDLYYYTIVGIADGKMYVMQMPSIDADDITSLDAGARLITAQEDGSIVLGNKYDFAFTNITYFYGEEEYYQDERIPENLLTDFCTGYYGSRTATIGLAGTVIERMGWTKLSGDKIARVEGLVSRLTYGNRTVFSDDGAVKIYAPRKGETENNSLRLVKDGNKFVFTGKDATTDTRPSYPIYIYRNYEKVETSDKFEFYGDLNKNSSFNVYKDVNVELETGENIYDLVKMESVRFVFTDLKGNIVEYGEIQSGEFEGNVNAPTTAGKYQLVLQLQVKGEKGYEWIDKTILQEFEIK